jgi:hypothetical protein
VPTAHDRALLSPVEVARPVDAVVRFMVRTVEILTRYHRQAPAPVLVAPKQLGMP